MLQKIISLIKHHIIAFVLQYSYRHQFFLHPIHVGNIFQLKMGDLLSFKDDNTNSFVTIPHIISKFYVHLEILLQSLGTTHSLLIFLLVQTKRVEYNSNLDSKASPPAPTIGFLLDFLSRHLVA